MNVSLVDLRRRAGMPGKNRIMTSISCKRFETSRETSSYGWVIFAIGLDLQRPDMAAALGALVINQGNSFYVRKPLALAFPSPACCCRDGGVSAMISFMSSSPSKSYGFNLRMGDIASSCQSRIGSVFTSKSRRDFRCGGSCS